MRDSGTIVYAGYASAGANPLAWVRSGGGLLIVAALLGTGCGESGGGGSSPRASGGSGGSGGSAGAAAGGSAGEATGGSAGEAAGGTGSETAGGTSATSDVGGSSGAAGSPGGSGGSSSWEPPEVVWPDPDSTEPFLLSETGLFADIEADELAPDLIAFQPAHQLWSDGATKRRWLRLPRGNLIDTSDLDHWQLPVGSVLFKEFTRDGVRVETRAIARLGLDRFDYWMGAFIWNEDGSDAVFTPEGRENARGTNHDVPSVTKCGTCHNGEASRALGFSAIQLSTDGTQSQLAWLANEGLLSDPPPASESIGVPGDAISQAALGYLHANCGHCHNPNGSARPDTDMNLRLEVAQHTPEDTNAYRTTVDVELQYFTNTELDYRVVPGNPAQSALIERMSERNTDTQMPPFATELVHEDGVAMVEAWIRSLGE